MKSLRRRINYRPLLLAALVAGGTLGATAAGATTTSPATASADTPKPGGQVTFGGYSYTELDYAQTGFILNSAPLLSNVYGTLFQPAIAKGGPLVPELALSYAYNRPATEITIQLRPNLKFSDGTPFTATSVVWNWNRDRNATAVTNQWLTTVKSIKAVGKTTVVVDFTQPDSAFIAEVAAEPLGFMASPTAFAREGATVFATHPVGAGPYKILTNQPAQVMTLVKNPNYWDAKHVYISSLKTLNTGTDSNAQYAQLESDAVQLLTLSGTSSSPTTLAQAITNHNLAVRTSPNDNLSLMVVNTFKPPFNNIAAREAVNYCTDRAALSKYTSAGFALPAYVLAGPAEQFTPAGGISGAAKLQSYAYNPQKASQFVSQLGGLNFTVLQFGGQLQTIATALQQQWTQCGIHATVTTVAPAVINPDLSNGSYQMVYTFTGGQTDPRLVTSFLDPTQPLNAFGFRDAQVASLLTKQSGETTGPELTKTWSQIWARQNALSVAMPVLTAPGYTFYNKCIHGLQFNLGTQYAHAWLACKA